MIDIVFVSYFDLGVLEEKSVPIGILSLCQKLREEKFSAKICNFNRLYKDKILIMDEEYQKNIECMTQHLIRLQPRIISFYTMASNYYIALSVCELIKSYNPEIITILAGPQASAVAVETLRVFPQIDIISIGEGELTICKLVSSLKKYKLNKLDGVKGISFRVGNQIKTNKNEEWIDVDETPILDFSLLENGDSNDINVIEMELGRGCPFNCTYCSTSRFWGRNYRIKSVDRVIEEIKFYQKKYKANIFLFQHDLFTFDKKYVIELCNKVLKEGLRIKWACYARIDVIDEEMIRIMASAGCIKLFLGLETGSAKMQCAVKKNIDVNKIFSLLSVFIECNMRITISFIYGFPQENDEDLKETLSLMYRIKNKSYELCKSKNWMDVFLSSLIYFPDTEITNEFMEELVFDEKCFEIKEKRQQPTKNIIEIIEKHKEIFPQYYIMPKMRAQKYKLLGEFINVLFPSFYYMENNLVNSVIEKNSYDILLLYLRAYEKYPEKIGKIYHIVNSNIKENNLEKIMRDILMEI